MVAWMVAYILVVSLAGTKGSDEDRMLGKEKVSSMVRKLDMKRDRYLESKRDRM